MSEFNYILFVVICITYSVSAWFMHKLNDLQEESPRFTGLPHRRKRIQTPVVHFQTNITSMNSLPIPVLRVK